MLLRSFVISNHLRGHGENLPEEPAAREKAVSPSKTDWSLLSNLRSRELPHPKAQAAERVLEYRLKADEKEETIWRDPGAVTQMMIERSDGKNNRFY
jgi:hypothetical protein